ncbi:MAG: hypothetical protein NWF00_00475 [Candidatus Bathyarchaeota archaeon]|nr:hypothetical protein [Candidatus Bathyarchaeota archaeon]
MTRPIGATVVYVIIAAASIWWLALGLMYFFGSFWWWYVGFPFAWLWGIMYGLLGLFGLGITAGLAAGYRQAYTSTLILAVIFLVFSIPALVNGYGIIGAALSAIVLVLLLIPNVKTFFRQESPSTLKPI